MAILRSVIRNCPSLVRSLRRLLWVLVLCPLLSGTCGAQVPPEYQVKAVFLFRFAEFVEWPPNAFPTPQSPIIFGVLGANPFGSALDEAVRGETIAGRRPVVRQFQRVDQITDCQILFIAEPDAQVPQTLASLRNRSILTVGESANFLTYGGIIQFTKEGDRVRFRINQSAAEAAKIKLSAKLLRLSQ